MSATALEKKKKKKKISKALTVISYNLTNTKFLSTPNDKHSTKKVSCRSISLLGHQMCLPYGLRNSIEQKTNQTKKPHKTQTNENPTRHSP